MTPTTARIAVIGANGKVGRLLLPMLVERGYAASGLVRAEEQLAAVGERGGAGVLLDVQEATEEQLAEALRGHDAVIWTAGAGGGSKERTYAIDRDAAIRSMAAAAGAGVQRYVMVSWFGSTPDHGIPEDDDFFAYADAKLAADQHLRDSGLDWTILGPGGLTDDAPSGSISVDGPYGQVSRGNVAHVAAAALQSSASVGQFIKFADGSTPITEVLPPD